MYAYKRVPNSEILMSQAIFVELGLSQPAWVALEAENAYSHVAIAFMHQEADEEESKSE